MPDLPLALCCYLGEVQRKQVLGLLGLGFCQVSRTGRERLGVGAVMESEKSEKSVIGGGWRLSGEDTLASDPKVGWGGS